MSYKFSDDYDEIIDINEEIEFIRGILGNISIAAKRQVQLLKIYELEHLNNQMIVASSLNPICEKEEMELIDLLHKRNNLLVTRYSLDFAKANPKVDKERINNLIIEYDKKIKETIIDTLTLSIQILSKRPDKKILDKERDVSKVGQTLEYYLYDRDKIQEQVKKLQI